MQVNTKELNAGPVLFKKTYFIECWGYKYGQATINLKECKGLAESLRLHIQMIEKKRLAEKGENDE